MSDKLETHFDGFTITEGQLISDRVQRIVMAITDRFDGEVVVEWIPDRQAQEQSRPQFKIVHRPMDGNEMILFYVKNEEEFDERVLLRLIQNDQRSVNAPTLNEYEAWEETQRAIEKQVYLDAMDEATELAAAVIRSTKDTYKVNDRLIFKEGIPFNAAFLKD